MQGSLGTSPPEQGQLVRVRQRIWSVSDVLRSEPLASLGVGAAAAPQHVFAVIQPTLQDFWIKRNASSMRTDVRYTPSDCFETFPFPRDIFRVDAPTMSPLVQAWSATGGAYDFHRQTTMTQRRIGLTATSKLFHSPFETGEDVAELR